MYISMNPKPKTDHIGSGSPVAWLAVPRSPFGVAPCLELRWQLLGSRRLLDIKQASFKGS